MKNTEQQQQAEAIAEHAWRQTPVALRAVLPDSAAPHTAKSAAQQALAAAEDGWIDGSALVAPLTVVFERAWDAQKARDGRSLTRFEEEPELIAQLAALLAAGTPLEPATEIVDIAVSSVRSWIKQGDEGDDRHRPVAILMKKARALFEAECVRNIRAAGRLPQFWAASATVLERTYPERWGRRTEEGNTPRVIVQIGVKDSDVQISVVAGESPLAPTQSMIEQPAVVAAPLDPNVIAGQTRPTAELSEGAGATSMEPSAVRPRARSPQRRMVAKLA